MTDEASVAAMLERVHADMPDRARFLVDRVAMTPVLTHPPLAIRRAALGVGAGARLVTYRVLDGLAILWALVPPALALIATVGSELPASSATPVNAVAQRLAGAYFVGLIAHRVALWTMFRRAFVARRSRGTRGRRLSRALLLVTSIVLLGLLIAESRFDAPIPGIVLAVALLSFLVLLLIGLLCGWFRSEETPGPRRLRRAIVEASAALDEGKPGEALSICDAVPDRLRDKPWIQTLRANALLGLGRPAEARCCIERTLERSPHDFAARYTLACITLAEGDAEAARDTMEGLLEQAGSDPEAWILAGLVHLERGPAEDAGRCFEKSAGLKEANARAVAGRVLAALLAGAPAPEVEGDLAKAVAGAQLDALVLLATACATERSGRHEEAKVALDRTLARLDERGASGWRPVLERLFVRIARVPPRTS